jgi:hypothetical protein
MRHNHLMIKIHGIKKGATTWKPSKGQNLVPSGWNWDKKAKVYRKPSKRGVDPVADLWR